MDGQRWLFFLSVAVPLEQPRRENITCQAGHRPITCLAGTSFRTNHALFSGGRKSETAAANASTLEIMFSAMGRGVAGYAKPNPAQTAKIANMPARRNNVYLASFMTAENGSRDSPHYNEIEGEFEDHRRGDGPHNGTANSDPEPATSCQVGYHEKGL